MKMSAENTKKAYSQESGRSRQYLSNDISVRTLGSEFECSINEIFTEGTVIALEFCTSVFFLEFSKGFVSHVSTQEESPVNAQEGNVSVADTISIGLSQRPFSIFHLAAFHQGLHSCMHKLGVAFV